MNDTQLAEKQILCIGVGNDFRHDDAVGLIIARRLGDKHMDNVEVIEASGEGASLMQLWAKYNYVIVIDAVKSDAKSGTIHHLNANHFEIPSDFFSYSTHAFSVAEAIEMARTLGQLPDDLLVFGVEGEDFTMGQGLSDCVEATVDVIVHEIELLVDEAV